MPSIEQQFRIDICPEKYIRACDQTELCELDLLLGIELSKIEARATNEKISMKDLLFHCLHNGGEDGPGISEKIKDRIRELLDLENTPEKKEGIINNRNLFKQPATLEIIKRKK